jgi:glutamate racemase
LKIEGVIESAVRQTTRLKPTRLALIGGRRTVLSGVYRKAFAAHGIHVTQRIAQPLSALIEKGDVGSDELRAACRRILTPIKHCSHLLLACTHYPAISLVLTELLSDNQILVNPANALTEQVKQWNLRTGTSSTFVTTGDPHQMRESAQLAFGFNTGKVIHVKV